MRFDVVDREPVAVLYAAAAGEPDRIPTAAARAFAALEAAIVPIDDERPWLEFYRRHDEVDLLVPVTG